jgi:hypothetical protein
VGDGGRRTVPSPPTPDPEGLRSAPRRATAARATPSGASYAWGAPARRDRGRACPPGRARGATARPHDRRALSARQLRAGAQRPRCRPASAWPRTGVPTRWGRRGRVCARARGDPPPRPGQRLRGRAKSAGRPREDRAPRSVDPYRPMARRPAALAGRRDVHPRPRPLADGRGAAESCGDRRDRGVPPGRGRQGRRSGRCADVFGAADPWARSGPRDAPRISRRRRLCRPAAEGQRAGARHAAHRRRSASGHFRTAADRAGGVPGRLGRRRRASAAGRGDDGRPFPRVSGVTRDAGSDATGH